MAENVMVFLACIVLALGTATMAEFECGEAWGTWWIRHNCSQSCGEEKTRVKYGALCEMNRTHQGKRVSVMAGQCNRGVCEESSRQSQIFHKLANESISDEKVHKPLDDENVMKMYILSNGSSVAHPCKVGHRLRVNGTRCLGSLKKLDDANVTVTFGHCVNGTCEVSEDDGSTVENKDLFVGLDNLYTETAPAC